jgi:hypothetical protein
MVGTGIGVAVAVGGGGPSGVYVADGVAVDPIAMGIPLQALKIRAIRRPNKARKWFIGVLILAKWRGVNGLGVVGKAVIVPFREEGPKQIWRI